jgi:transposase
MTKDMVIAGSKRRRWTTAEKAQIVRESLMAGARVAEVAHRHDVNSNLIYAWRRRTKIGALSPAAVGQPLVPVIVLADREAGVERRVTSDLADHAVNTREVAAHWTRADRLPL